MSAAPLRVPLQTGVACLNRCIAALPFAALGGLGLVYSVSGDWGQVAVGILITTIGLVGALVLFIGAVSARASDAHIDAAGLTILGGPNDGLSVNWSLVDPRGCAVVWEPRGNRGWTRFVLEIRDGRIIAAARGNGDFEARSLRAFLCIVRAASTPPSAEAKPVLLACAACGAPAAPEDAPSVTCRYCRASVDVPESIRVVARAAAGKAHDAAMEPVVARLLRRQASARTVTALTAVAALLFVTGSVEGTVRQLGVIVYAPSLIVVVIAAAVAANRRGYRSIVAGLAAHPIAGFDSWKCRSCGAPLPAVDGTIARCNLCLAENVVGVGIPITPEERANDELDVKSILADLQGARISSVMRGVAGVACCAPLTLWVADFYRGSAPLDTELKIHVPDENERSAEVQPAPAHSAATDVGVATSAPAADGGFQRVVEQAAERAVTEVFGPMNEYDREQQRVHDELVSDPMKAAVVGTEHLLRNDAMATDSDLLEHACKDGIAFACANLGVQRARYTVYGAPGSESAMQVLQSACETQHIADACLNLGDLYYLGHGVGEDPAEAAALFARACELGSPIACGNAGALFYNGTGAPPRDEARARLLLARACKAGFPQWCPFAR